MLETKSQRSFVTLDGLRGIAALAIISRHAPAYFASVSLVTTGDAAQGPVAGVPFFESYLAVDFFFALSGFVLAHAYVRRFRDGMSTLQFMAIRLVRLYPLYLFALALSVLLDWRELAHGEINHVDFLKNVIPALFFLPSAPLHAGARLFPLNEPAWSLFFELLANFSFGLVCLRLTGGKLCAVVLSAGLALALAVAAGLFGFARPGIGAMNAGFEWHSFVAGGLRVGYSFFAGVLVYQMWCHWGSVIKVPPLALVLLLIVILVAYPPQQYQVAFDIVVTVFIFPVIIWFGAGSVAAGPMARAFTWLGLSSYAVYVLQWPLYNLTLRECSKIWGGTCGSGVSYGIAFVALVFSIAIIVDRYFDNPVRSILTTRFIRPFDQQRVARAVIAASDVQSSRF